MSVTSGFFNSLNGDRKYSAEQMSSLFTGIINDGVFMSVGNCFAVTAGSGLTVNVDSGRAWFNETWTENDTIYVVALDNASTLADRYDAIVIEVDKSDTTRACSIKAVTGSPSTSPTYPEMTSDEYVHQYPLAYVYVKASATSISQSNITNMVGTSSCPFITGILETVNIDNLILQWKAQWEESYAEWGNEFVNWFNTLQVILEGDVATDLTNRVLTLEEKVNSCLEIPLNADDWIESGTSGYEQIWTVLGVTEDDLCVPGVIFPTNCTRTQQKAINKASGLLYDVEINNNSITFRSTEKPSTDYTIGLVFLSGNLIEDGSDILDNTTANVQDYVEENIKSSANY